MKLKLLTVIVLCTALFFSSLIWLMDSFFYGDRTKWAEMTLRSQVSVTSQAIFSETQFLKKWISSASDDGVRKISWNNFSPYFAAGIIQKLEKSWTVLDFNIDPKGSWSGFSQEAFMVQFFKWNLNFERSVSFYAYTDSDKRTSVITFIPSADRVWFFVHGGEPFQSIIDSQKGSLSSLGVVTKDTLTLAHTTSEYIGQKMSQSPFQEELTRAKAVSGSGTYNLKNKDDVYVYFQKIPDLDTYVYATIPIEELMKGRKKLALQLILMSLGLILVLSAFILRVTKASTQEIVPSDFAHPVSDLMNKTKPIEIKNDNSMDAILDKAVLQKEKMMAYTKMASAVGHELKMPLLAILGYAQNLLSKASDPDSKKVIEALIGEARGSRQVLDKILGFAGEKNQERTLMKLEVPILRALKNLEPIIQQKKILINKDFHETPAVYINCDNLIQAFENILVNCIEAMDKMPNKEIEIRLQNAGNKIELSIKDKGEGILEENREKVFEPFFTTKSSQHKIGLGLSVSHGILKEHLASIEVKSVVGEGTSFLILFDKTTAIAKANPVAEKIENLQTSLPRRLKTDEIKLNIPKYDEIQLKSEDEISEQTSGNKTNHGYDGEKSSGDDRASVDDKLNLILGGEVTKTSTVLRKPNDVDVDQLLDMSDVKSDDDKTVVIESGNQPIETASQVSLIDSPKKNQVGKPVGSEQYKVTIRRPERKN